MNFSFQSQLSATFVLLLKLFPVINSVALNTTRVRTQHKQAHFVQFCLLPQNKTNFCGHKFCSICTSQSMSTTINRLPDEILAGILNRLSLQELAPLDLVSHRWKSVQEYVLSQKSSLTLYQKEFAIYHEDFFQLMFFEQLNNSHIKHSNSLMIRAQEIFSASKSHWLVNKLPNITELSMWRPCFTEIDVEHLLDNWTGLEKLNIGDYDLEDGIEDFWLRINRLNSLKHLGLISNCDFDSYVNVFQLETLCIEYFYFEKENLPLSNIIIKLGPNIRHLCLSNVTTTEQELTKCRNALLQNDVLAKTLSNQVTYLTLQSNHSSAHLSVTLPVLNFIVDHFGSLTHLDICLYKDLYMHDIVGPLSQLKKLTSLRFSSTIMEDYEEYSRIYQANADLLGNGIQSVRKLHLASNVSTPATPKADFYKDILQLAFPGLTELRFEKSIQMYQCVDCNSGDKNFLQSSQFDSGSQCVCPLTLWDTFSRMKLKVYRNNQLVYDHHKTSTFEQFLVRL